MSNSALIKQVSNPFDPGYFLSEELGGFGFKSIGHNVKIAKNCTIIGLSNISIGSNVRIDGHAVLAAHSGFLDIGNYVHIAGGSVIGCAGGVTLSDFSGLSHAVKIYSSSDDYSGGSLTNPTVPSRYLSVSRAPVHVGRHVIIGSGSVVLPGATIGDGASIGALSLVNGPLDGWGVYAGTPVRWLKARAKTMLDLEQKLSAEHKA